MKRRTKAILAFVLMIVLIVSSVTIIHAASEQHFFYELSATEAAPGDTFTATLSVKGMTASSVSASIKYDPDKVEVLSIEGVEDPTDPTIYLLTNNKKAPYVEVISTTMEDVANVGITTSPTVSIVRSATADTNYLDYDILIATFKVKDGVTEDITFSLREQTDGTDAFQGDNLSVQTVKVQASEVVPTSVSLDKDSLSLKVGDVTENPLVATVEPDGADQSVTWSTSNSSVATVNNGVVTAVAAGTATITATSTVNTDLKATCAVTVSNVEPSSISVNPTSVTVEVGESSAAVTATVLPSNAYNRSVDWTSEDSSVATVVDGVITGVKIGNTTVKAKSAVNDSLVAEVAVSVVATSVTGVSLNESTTSIVIGDTKQLTATVAPTNATNKDVTWSSDKPAIASVADGVVTANGVGEANITVTTVDGEFTASCKVTVTPIDVTAVTVNPETANAEVGDTVELTATVVPGNATYNTVTWSSGDETKATVSSDGKVTCLAEGTVVITAAAGGKEDSCTITITTPAIPVTSVTLNKSKLTLCPGATDNSLSATVLPAEATNKTVNWSSGDTSIATVDSNGVVTAVAKGSTTITATAGGKSDSCTVTVQHNMTHTPASAATCEGAGNDEYWYCSNCENYYADENGNTKLDGIPTIDALGHDWKATWHWADDGASATVELKCDRNSSHTVEPAAANVTINNAKSVPATCASAGSNWYDGTYSYDGKDFSDSKSVTVEALPHTKNDDSHHAAVPATCLSAGNVEYWECAECHQKFSDEAMTLPLTNVEVPKLAHTMTHTASKVATCEEAGNDEYWYCSSCEKYYADENGDTEFTGKLVINALGHDWQVVWGEWIWPETEGLPTVTATLVCQNNGEHTVSIPAENITVVLDEANTVVPSCTVEGKVTAKASFTYDEVKYESSDEKKLGYLPHTAGTHVDAVAATCEEDGNVEYWTCSECHKTFSDEALTTEIANTVVEKLGHKWDEENPVIVKAATITERGEMYYICLNNENHHSDNIPIPALNENVYEGTGASWTKGSNESALVVSEADYSKFDSSEYVGVYVDNMLVDKANYNSKSGSTQIIFKPEYLETLTTGAHNVMIVSNDGISNVTLTIEPKIEVVDGQGATYEKDSDTGLPIEINVPVAAVVVDGVKLDPSNYTISDDGKTVTINKEYLDSLDGDKEYKIELVAENGSKIETTVKVAPKSDNNSTNGNADNKGGKDGSSPKTGDNGIAVLVIAMIASAGVFFVGKKKELF